MMPRKSGRVASWYIFDEKSSLSPLTLEPPFSVRVTAGGGRLGALKKPLLQFVTGGPGNGEQRREREWGVTWFETGAPEVLAFSGGILCSPRGSELFFSLSFLPTVGTRRRGAAAAGPGAGTVRSWSRKKLKGKAIMVYSNSKNKVFVKLRQGKVLKAIKSWIKLVSNQNAHQHVHQRPTFGFAAGLAWPTGPSATVSAPQL